MVASYIPSSKKYDDGVAGIHTLCIILINFAWQIYRACHSIFFLQLDVSPLLAIMQADSQVPGNIAIH